MNHSHSLSTQLILLTPTLLFLTQSRLGTRPHRLVGAEWRHQSATWPPRLGGHVAGRPRVAPGFGASVLQPPAPHLCQDLGWP